jgi:hypothetical protein
MVTCLFWEFKNMHMIISSTTLMFEQSLEMSFLISLPLHCYIGLEQYA